MRSGFQRLFQRSTVWVLTVACIPLCCVCWIAAAYYSEIERDYPVFLVDTKSSVDASVLPERPTEEDWYLMAGQALKDSGWDYPLRLTTLNGKVSCDDPYLVNSLHLGFTYVDFATVMPHVKAASVLLYRFVDVAPVSIEDKGPGWGHLRAMDIPQITVGMYEAIAIADAHGGQEFREGLKNRCDIGITLAGYEWYFDYNDDRESTVPALTIQVNARTGKVKQVPW